MRFSPSRECCCSFVVMKNSLFPSVVSAAGVRFVRRRLQYAAGFRSLPPGDRPHAHPRHGARSRGRLGAHRPHAGLAKPRAHPCLDRSFVLPVPRAERGGHLRFGAAAAAAGVPACAHRALHRPPPHRGADSRRLPQCGRAAQDASVHQPLPPFGPSARHAALGGLDAAGRAARPPHCSVAEPRTLFRSASELLALAACASVGDLRGPLHAGVRAAFPGADARKCGGERAAAARARRAARRAGGRQRPRYRRAVRAMPRRRAASRVERRRPRVRAPEESLPRGRESLPRGYGAPHDERDRGCGVQHGRVVGRHSRGGRIRCLCQLPEPAGECGGCVLHGAPPGRRAASRSIRRWAEARGSTWGRSLSPRGAMPRGWCSRTFRRRRGAS